MKQKIKNGKLCIPLTILFAFVFMILFTGAGKIGADKKLNSIENYIRRQEPEEPETLTPPVSVDVLILVNKKNRVADNFVPDNLCNLSELVPATKSVIYFNKQAAADYASMISGMEEDGLTGLYAVSGYRTYMYQDYLFKQKVATYKLGKEQAEIAAGRIVAPPGASEHQTGLALDVSARSVAFALNSSFTVTAEYKWLVENCHKYGFIIRYPENKRHITEIIFEPWHLRYVGAEHAEAIYEAGICLEEYIINLEKKESLNDFQPGLTDDDRGS